jgi:hypothetical protein
MTLKLVKFDRKRDGITAVLFPLKYPMETNASMKVNSRLVNSVELKTMFVFVLLYLINATAYGEIATSASLP